MHHAILVAGDDPLDQLVQDWTPWERGDSTAQLVARPEQMVRADFYAIGGRFSGQLVPLPGATSGRLYGDAVPSMEALIMARSGDVMVRPKPQQATGFDQIRKGELDIAATFGRFKPLEFVAAGFDAPGPRDSLTSREQAALIGHDLGLRAGPDAAGHHRALSAAHRKIAVWESRVSKFLAALPGDALLTVVDAHV